MNFVVITKLITKIRFVIIFVKKKNSKKQIGKNHFYNFVKN